MAAKARKRKDTPAKTLTAGTVITFEEPESSRKKEPVIKAVVEDINPVDGFSDWLRNHAIIGLSIGFIIGNQMASFVRVLVEKLIDPLTLLLFGTKLSQRTLTLEFNDRIAVFGWGAVVYNLIIITVLILIIFFAFKYFKLEKFDKPKDEDKK